MVVTHGMTGGDSTKRSRSPATIKLRMCASHQTGRAGLLRSIGDSLCEPRVGGDDSLVYQVEK